MRGGKSEHQSADEAERVAGNARRPPLADRGASSDVLIRKN